MSRRDVVIVAGAWGVSLWLVWTARPQAPAPPGGRPDAGGSPAAGARARDAEPTRDLFEFERAPFPPAEPEPVATPVPESVEIEPIAPLAEPDPVRVIGIVRQAGQHRAMLSVEGESTLLGRGQGFRGYEVVSVSEESVRLRDPSGRELILQVPLD